MINQLCHQANLQIEHHNLTTTESAEELLAYRQADPVFTRMPITNRRHDLSALSDGADAGGLPGGPSATRNAYLGRVTGAGVFTHYITNDPVIQRVQQSSIAWLNPRNIAFRSDSFMTILQHD